MIFEHTSVLVFDSSYKMRRTIYEKQTKEPKHNYDLSMITVRDTGPLKGGPMPYPKIAQRKSKYGIRELM